MINKINHINLNYNIFVLQFVCIINSKQKFSIIEKINFLQNVKQIYYNLSLCE